MKNNDRNIDLYNKLLSVKLEKYKIVHWENLNTIDRRSLEKLFLHFFGLMLSKGLDQKEELNELGKQLDAINGRINLAIISKDKKNQ